MRISFVVAMDRRATIGFEGGLPWHLPADLKRFRKITWGKPILMGRKTHESIGRALPGRPNIVLSRREVAPLEGVHFEKTPAKALSLAEKLAEELGVDEVMIVGGAEVYRLFLDRVDRIYLTVVEGNFEGSAFFPLALPGQANWRVADHEHHPADENNLEHHNYTLDRLPNKSATSEGILDPIRALLETNTTESSR